MWGVPVVPVSHSVGEELVSTPEWFMHNFLPVSSFRGNCLQINFIKRHTKKVEMENRSRVSPLHAPRLLSQLRITARLHKRNYSGDFLSHLWKYIRNKGLAAELCVTTRGC